MKRFLFILFGWLLGISTLQSQSVIKYHYWYDNDISTMQNGLLGYGNLILDVDDLDDGLHSLYVMLEGESLMPPQRYVFVKMSPQLPPSTVELKYHYWYDNDVSNMQIGLLGDGNLILDVDDLEEGLHSLYVVLEGESMMSPQRYMFVKISPQLPPSTVELHYRYWYDNDISNVQSGLLGDGILVLDANGLTDGLHSLYVMLEGESLMPPQRYVFVKMSPQLPPSTVELKYHYWYDNDVSNMQIGLLGDGNLILDVDDLEEGLHSLYVVLEGESMMSPQRYMFVKMSPQLPPSTVELKYRYWFDNDINNMQNGLLGGGNLLLDANALDEGEHTLYIMLEGDCLMMPQSYNFTKSDTIFDMHCTDYYFMEDTTLCNVASYNWHGYTYTESGIYYDSLQTVNGCDSIFQLSLELFNTPLGEFASMTPTDNYPFTSLPVTFTWDAVSGAEYYDLYVWDEDDPMPNEPFASNLTGRNYSTTALFNYHTYNWFVMARNACYETSSSVKSFYLVIEPSLNVNVEHIDFGEVTFNQSVSTTLSVSGVVLEDSLNVQISGNDAAMFSITEASGWNDYTGGILIVTFYPTVPQYSYNANIVINSGTISTTTSLTGGLADMFVFNTYVAEDVYAMNSSIPIYGSLTDLNDNPVANEEIEIGVFVMGMKRTLQAFTDGSGQFSAVFEPMPSESGYYTVNSGRVGNHSTAVHDDFNIPGMTLVSSDYILCTVTQDQPRTDSILIRNKSNLSLSNIQVSPISVPDGASFSFMPLSLGGLEENWLVYTVNGSTLTQGNYYEEARLKATSSEGAEMSLSIWYYCMEPRGVLDVMPKSLATTMTKGKSKIVDVMLTNNGTAATGNIYIDLPDVEWMSVVGNGTLSSIAVNDTAYFSIRFSPAEDIQLGQYSGTIVINSERGDAVGLPYMITAVSDSTGMFVIDVTDDYTWNTNNGHGPHLEGAEVTLKGYYSFETVAQGYTDANGIFQIDNLPEGYYRLHVVADRHSQYDNNILITAGETNHQDIYLQYQAITYSWTVEPTEIVDEYTYELNVVFETNVPVPVVVIEAPKKLPEFDESYTFNYVITNHGLIDANDVELHVPISDDYLFTPLFDHIDTLQALTTIVIPCIVVHNDYREDFLRNDCAEWGFTWTEYTYKCHKIDGTIEVNSSSGFVYTLLGSKPCNPPEGGNGNGGNGFNAPLLGIVGGHGGGFGNPFFTSPLLEMWYECDNGCTNMVLWGIDKLLSKAPLISYVYNTAKTILDIATFMENDAEDNLITMYDLYSDISESLGESVPFNPAMAYLSISKEVETVKQNIIHCYKYLNGTATRNYELELDYLEVPNEIGAMLQYMDEYVSAATKIVDIMDMYFCDTTWFDSENNELDGFMNMVFEYNSMYGRVYVDQALLSYKPSNISDDQAISFVERFNNTVDIYNGIVINNDNFIPIDSINSKLLSIINIENEAILLGFESGVDRITHLIDEAYEYLEENKSSSVCAKVKVQFSQKMTMTREAFDGTFTVHNGHDTEPMEAIGLDFVIKDEDGNVCNNLFQINILSLSNSLTGIDGSGSLGAGLDGVAKIQFIPTKYAALTEPKVYYFGGTFSFIDPYTLDEIVYDLYPVELTVHPSPDLYVDYFMQRDILGDDALTEDVVEPSVPAELGVIINNKGAGIAKNVLLETAEPKIIDNEKGLAIDFTMYGASFNGSPRQLGLMEIPFGNIEAGHTAVGEWQFTSTLLGHFISYEAHVIHNSSYGNPDLSLVSHLAIHELIHPIYAYGDLDDGINDFLVNDIPDAYDTPDSIYFSHGGKTSVGIVDNISYDHLVSPTDSIVTLTVMPSRIGWNYGMTDDPGMNQYYIVRCIRNNDNKVIPLNNVWLTFVTIPDGGDPVYENKLHIVDTVSSVETVSYTLTYSVAPPEPSNVPIGAIDGLFSVSDSQQVYFSKGNLQYQATTNTWRFAENQWDCQRLENRNISLTYDGWIDLFCWGTSGYDHGAVCYQPWSTSQSSSDYYAYGSFEYNLYDQTGQADWGYNAISNGGNALNQWRTLTKDEWSYLFFDRDTPSGIRYAKAIVNNVEGLVVLPDNWDSTYYSLNETDSIPVSFSTNIITENDWLNILEPHGVLFLPAGSYRSGTYVENINPFRGYYWASSYSNQSRADHVEFNDFTFYYVRTRARNHGLSVRLVRTAQGNGTYTINTTCSPANGGTVTGGGTYQQGQTCTLTAIANNGYTFTNWTENGNVVSTNACYTITVTANRNLVANFIQNNVPTGAINGIFSVSNSRQVYFSHGNLQYQATTNTWRFAEHQWDCFRLENANISSSYDGWIDLFGWGTSGYNHGATCYQPWSTSGNYFDYYAYGSSEYNLYDQTGKADWGYNAISNGGNTENQWRTLTSDEWSYLIFNRETPSGIRFAKAVVNNMEGLVVLPDNWDSSIYDLQNTNTVSATYTSNIITENDWVSVFEPHGVLFLPAGSYRNGSSYIENSNKGYYWASTYSNQNQAGYFEFNNIQDESIGLFVSNRWRNHGLSVRLARTIQYTINTTCLPTEGGTVVGAGTYNSGETCSLTATANNGYSFVNWTKNGEQVSTDATYSFTVTEDASFVANFRNALHFTIAGTWSTTSNWQGGILPGANDEVFIDAPCQLDQNATVFALTVSDGQSLTLQSGKTLIVTNTLTNTSTTGLVIEDGAQLEHASNNVSAMVKKYIAGHGTNNGKFHLISNPLASTINPELASIYHLTRGNYDLYNWLACAPDHLEWRNFKDDSFMMYAGGYGYLYANQNGMELNFPGTLLPSKYRFGKSVNYDDNNTEHPGWNLIGNPFVCNAYLVNENNEPLPFYRMNTAGNDLEAVSSGAIAPMEGVFYQASENGTVYFIRTDNTSQIPTSCTISVSTRPYEGGTVSGGGTFMQGQSCTVQVTPASGYEFMNWTENGVVVSTNSIYTFTVNDSRNLVANFSMPYVDLGLPSGLLWATCNVGANSPEDYGEYFAWGETQPKTTYDWSTYQYCNGSYNTITKYCCNSYFGYNGFQDNMTTLQLSDDAATNQWGNGWRMPTSEEWNELLNNTTNIWTTRNGVNGLLFIATNGNSLFLPAAGIHPESSFSGAGNLGYYWSSSLNTDYSYSAQDLYINFAVGHYSMDTEERGYGLSIRPVRSSR